MQLRPGQQAEYERRHNPVWPEMQTLLSAHGVRNYSIFLDRATDRLFAYAECDSEERWRAIAATEVCQRWWAHMRALMDTHPDNRPVSVELAEVFHLD